MTVPVYEVRFHQNHWRIRFEDYYFGEYETAEAAASIASQVAEGDLSRGLKTKVTIKYDGRELLSEAETPAGFWPRPRSFRRREC